MLIDISSYFEGLPLQWIDSNIDLIWSSVLAVHLRCLSGWAFAEIVDGLNWIREGASKSQLRTVARPVNQQSNALGTNEVLLRRSSIISTLEIM